MELKVCLHEDTIVAGKESPVHCCAIPTRVDLSNTLQGCISDFGWVNI